VTEEWRPVVGYEGLYEVSDHGNVRSVDRVVAYVDGRVRQCRGQVLAQSRIAGREHRKVNLYSEGIQRAWPVHVLVLTAFVGPAPAGTEACHYDDDATNNHLGNLRWDTRSGNLLDRVRNGRHAQAQRTHCPRQHRLAAPNLHASYAARGGRQCLACHRAEGVVRSAARRGVVRDFEAIAHQRYAEIVAATTPEWMKEQQ
jgi:hypothetical protein